MIITAVLFWNGSRGFYPGYAMRPTDGCQIPQRRDTPRLGENGPCFCGGHGSVIAASGVALRLRFCLYGLSDQCLRTPHCGDTLARAGEVLALVSQLPSAAPAQSHGSGDLVSPLKPALPIFVGCIGVRGGIWVRTASKSRDHGWALRRHAGTGVFAYGLLDIAGGWGGCRGCGGQADLRG
jgi:hypothetical protein